MYFCTKVIEIIKMRKDMENNMFCFQCQETAKGFGCTLKGVCGKNATTARTMAVSYTHLTLPTICSV